MYSEENSHRLLVFQVRDTFAPFGAIASVRLVRDSTTGAEKGIGFVEFEDPSSVPLAIRQAATKVTATLGQNKNNATSTEPEGIIIDGRQLRVQAWKSVKKAKPVANRQGGGRRQPPPQERGGSSVRIPTNFRGGGQERKQFVKKALQRRDKRKQVAESKKPKKDKQTKPTLGGNAKAKKIKKPKKVEA